MIDAHSQSSLPAWIFIVLRWVAAFLVLGVLLRFLPVAPLRSALAHVPLSRFLAIFLGYLLAHAFGILKWRMVVNAAGAGLDFTTCAECYTGGLFATLFLPSIIGGDVIRLAVGLRRSPRPAAVLAGNLADRFLDVSAQATLVLIGLLLLPGSVPVSLQSAAHKILLMSIAAILVGVVIALLLYRPIFRGRSFRFRRRLARVHQAVRSVSQRPRVLVSGWMLGTLIQFTFVVLTALLAISCGLFLPLRIWLFAWPLAKLAALLPLTQGGIGVREAALVALLVPFGASGPVILAAGLAWEGIIVAGGLFAGLLTYFARRAQSRPAP